MFRTDKPLKELKWINKANEDELRLNTFFNFLIKLLLNLLFVCIVSSI